MSSQGPLVVAVSGTSGAGKTTLVRRLEGALAARGLNVTTLFFDDYADEGKAPQDDLAGWLARGADPDEWRTDAMVTDLQALADVAGTAGGARAVIVVEEPFGRGRSAMRPLVDVALHIDLPLEIALARRLARDIPAEGALTLAATIALRQYLNLYLGAGATMYRVINDLAREDCDLVLDGRADIDQLTEQAIRQLALHGLHGRGSVL